MYKSIILLALVANLNYVLTDGEIVEAPPKASTVIEDRLIIRCGPNQIYDVCPTPCPPRTCKTKDIAFRCMKPLKPGDLNCPRPRCRCADGYFSNDEGLCVPKEKCPGYVEICGPNEVWVPSGTCYLDQTCENVNQDIAYFQAVDESRCKGACRCRPGFYRSKITNQCVRAEECVICSENEEYNTCPSNLCREQTCDQVGYGLLDCPLDRNNTECGRPQCVCKEGHVRNNKGICVPKRECPSCGGDPNAWSGCGTFCTQCTGAVPCPKICRVNSCDCRPNYVYDATIKKCVKPEQCPPKCGTNEVPSECGNNPCQSTCEKPDLNTYCDPNPANCKPGCICAKGYLRDSNGRCVPWEKCPNSQCKENEEYTNCTKQICRPKTCKDLGYPLNCYQFDRVRECGEPGCVCKPGYVQNERGVCIPIRNCTSCAGDPNAWSGCGTFCETCSNYKNKDRACILICMLNGCDCRPGYVYDETTKKCVLPEQCPPQCGANEVPSDCATSRCLPNCAAPYLDTYCRPNPADCKPGCVCADGYVRNEKGDCVKISECIRCKDNEELSECPNKYCIPTRCDELGFPLECSKYDSKDIVCGRPRCVCKPPLVRNKDGVCIKPNECPSCGGDPNAEPGCGSYCINCDNYLNRTRICPIGCILNGCQCRKGYIYDKVSKKCVLPEHCPPRCPINEVPSDCATDSCLPTCAEPDLDTYCKPNPANCKPGCVCAEGFVRNEKGVCVKRSECIRCKDNEELSECPNKYCIPTRCDELGFPLECSKYDSKDIVCGRPRCVCKSPLVRNKDGVCVYPNECPSCGGDPNAQNGCGSFCINCDNYLNGTRICPIGCNLNGCECRKGYVYDNITKKCVLPEQCPPRCPINETPSDCANSPCLPTCAQIYLNTACKPNPDACKPGCVCIKGYSRDRRGICVPKNQCPKKCGPLEVYSDCANGGCTKRNCSQVAQPALCIDIFEGGCIGDCVCIDDHLRTDAGECVPISKCPPKEICPLPHEYYDECPQSCPVRRCDVDDRLILCKPSEGCKPSCVCEVGFYRSKEGYCVTFEECRKLQPTS